MVSDIPAAAEAEAAEAAPRQVRIAILEVLIPFGASLTCVREVLSARG